MKTSKKDFEKFKQYCEEYKNLFGLNNWTIYYEHELGGKEKGYACQYSNYLWGVTIKLNTDWFSASVTDELLKDTARHEILHLITARLHYIAKSRYVTSEQLQDADELAVKYMEGMLDATT